jgi:hypothetical protein
MFYYNNKRAVDMENNYDWYVNADLSKFSGKWVAILDKKIIASDKDARKVIEKIKGRYPNSKPLLAKVASETLIL